MTVKDLIAVLSKYPADMEVRYSTEMGERMEMHEPYVERVHLNEDLPCSDNGCGLDKQSTAVDALVF